MSTHLQTQRFLKDSVETESAAARNANPLNFEMGWYDVASGLARILWGLALIPVAIGIALIVILTLMATPIEKLIGPRPEVGTLWLIIGGGGLVGLLMLFSCVIVLTGKWKCAVNAPDRYGARWLIFGCILCMTAGIVVNIAGSIGIRSAATSFAAKHQAELRDGFEGNEELQQAFVQRLMQPALNVHMISTALNLATMILFVLFLRAVGVCFFQEALTKSSEFYLMFSSLLFGIFAFLMFFGDGGRGDLVLLAGLGVGWILGVVWYVTMIFWARGVILHGMAEVRKKEVFV